MPENYATTFANYIYCPICEDDHSWQDNPEDFDYEFEDDLEEKFDEYEMRVS